MAPTPAELRSWLGSQIRHRVVGPDADVRHTELFDTDEPGWFDDDAPIRRVHADASMFIGGMRALLFQSLHPLAMAGVAQHSDYRADPWGRLQRTADFLAATTFGPTSEAQRAVDVVHRVHQRVVGTSLTGGPTPRTTPICCIGSTSPSLTAFSQPTTASDCNLSSGANAIGTSLRRRSSLEPSVLNTHPKPRTSSASTSARSDPSSAVLARRVTLRAT